MISKTEFVTCYNLC